MLGLTTVRFVPDDDGMKILKLMSEGKSQNKIAEKIEITYAAMRQRITQLRLNLGACNNNQMMFEYGRYLERSEKKR